jgi:hypothetical protein
MYRLLGRTGLRVSPLALGAMTFGQKDWGADEDTARSLFRHYLDAGGNFLDTANAYADGRSEELLGTFVRETNSRDRVVLATKFTAPFLSGKYQRGKENTGRLNAMAGAPFFRQRTERDWQVAALDVELTTDQQARLEEAGRPELYQPYILFDPDVVRAIATRGYEVTK